MPSYNDLRPDTDESRRAYALTFPNEQFDGADRRRTIERLLALRAGLDERVPAKRADQNLLIASWNIKELGHTKQRLPECFFYLAEIVNRFDIVAVQEVKRGLEDLQILMKLLGEDWSFLVNDVTEGTDGNRERSAYLYNNKRVELSGLAGELVLWDALTADSDVKQLKRTPYMTGFRAGWKSFAIISLHLHPGETVDDVAYRREEVRLLLSALAEKRDRDHLFTPNLLLTGDFNFYEGSDDPDATPAQRKDDPTVQLIVDAGYREVDGLRGLDTNASETERYDRLFVGAGEYFRVARRADGVENGGVFNPFDYVIRFGDEATYLEKMKAVYGGAKNLDVEEDRDWYFREHWRKNQLSDHYPIWFELVIDSSDDFLQEKLEEYD